MSTGWRYRSAKRSLMRTWKLTRGCWVWKSSSQGSSTWRPRSDGMETDSVPDIAVLSRAIAFLPASSVAMAERAYSR